DALHAVERRAEREIDRELFGNLRVPLRKLYARQLARLDDRSPLKRVARIGHEYALFADLRVETVRAPVLVEIKDRTLFRRDRAQNIVGEDIAESERRSDIHVGDGHKPVFEILHGVGVKATAALVRQFALIAASRAVASGIEFGAEQTIGDEEGAERD